MINFKKHLVCFAILLSGAAMAATITKNDAATSFNAYNKAFFASGYYPGWWTGAEEIEMAEDAYERAPSLDRKRIVTSACNGFIAKQGASWMGNDFNDDIAWAVIAFSRGYLITGNVSYRDIAKANFDAMYSRAWDTNFTGGGLWWKTEKQCKNACINGPAAIGACYLYSIYGDSSYLSKAQDCYAWERRMLFNPDTGAIADNVNINPSSSNTWPSTYNQGTFIGAANFLYRATGLPSYYQDAILAAKHTQNKLSSSGILPEYGSGDTGGFNGIFARWMARFARDQDLWSAFGPWLTTNAVAAWSVRNPTNNLAWQKWKTPTKGKPDAWDCSAAVVIMQVADPSLPDPLQITPTTGFTAVWQRSLPPNLTSTLLMLTNTGTTALNWSLVNTSKWLRVSADSGTLPAGGLSNITVDLIPSAITRLPAGRYYAGIGLIDLDTGVVSRRLFTLVVSDGDVPIAMTGYNAAVLAPNSATSGNPNATAFDLLNNFCFYQAGLNASTRGLPPNAVFTSQVNLKTIFQLEPYGSTNALLFGGNYPSSATLTLTTPQGYNSLSLLASSANAADETGTLVLNFTNGTHSQVLNFNAPDWLKNDSAHNIAIQGMGRLKLGTGFTSEDNESTSPKLYQTTLNLASLGLAQPIASITFTKPANAGSMQSSAVFAISGTAKRQY